MSLMSNLPHDLASRRRRQETAGFNLVELLVVISVMGLLAALLLPALGRSKATAQRTVCLNNLKQLQLAYLNYVHDSDDWFPPNNFGDIDGIVQSFKGSWVLGNAQYDTNTSHLEAGVIFPYAGSTQIYHCPSDRSSIEDAPSLLRTRSYGLSGWLHANGLSYGIGGNPDTHKQIRLKITALGKLPPAECFALIDQHERSIDDGAFLLAIPYSWQNPDRPSDTRDWYELPADRHQQGANLSFLDGHATRWSWKAPKQFRRFGQRNSGPLDLEDLRRLQHASPNE